MLAIYAYGERAENQLPLPLDGITPYSWAWTESEGYFKIYWLPYSFDEFMGHCQPKALACTYEHTSRRGNTEPPVYVNVHTVHYLQGLTFVKTLPGCNLFTHESLHHWGYNENMLWDFFECGVKSKYNSLPRIGVT